MCKECDRCSSHSHVNTLENSVPPLNWGSLFDILHWMQRLFLCWSVSKSLKTETLFPLYCLRLEYKHYNYCRMKDSDTHQASLSVLYHLSLNFTNQCVLSPSFIYSTTSHTSVHQSKDHWHSLLLVIPAKIKVHSVSDQPGPRNGTGHWLGLFCR